MTDFGENMRQVFDIMDSYQIDYQHMLSDGENLLSFMEMADELIDRHKLYGNITYLEEWAADWLTDYQKLRIH